MKYTIYPLFNEWGSWHYVTPLDKIDELEAWWEDDAWDDSWRDDFEERPLPDGVFMYETPLEFMKGHLVFENPTVEEELPPRLEEKSV